MLIFSKYKDYYDNILSHGIDKSLVYKREEQYFLLDCNPFKMGNNIGINKENVELLSELRNNLPMYDRNWFVAIPFFIGFCGKIYLGYKLKYSYNGSKESIAWSVQDIVNFLEENKLEIELEKFQTPNKKSKSAKKRIFIDQRNKFCYNDMKDIFELYNHDVRLTKMFIEYKVPIFSINFKQRMYTMEVTLNPNLKDCGFIKVIDPYTAFQEISMYIGGVLGVDAPETVVISDKEKAIKHGMDKTSFRTPSPGKKFNRRNQ